MCRMLVSTQRQARKVTLCPSPTVKDRLLSLNRTQSKTVTGLLTGHNTLRRYLYLMGLINSPLCSRCGAEEETSAPFFCECEALASLRHAYLGSFFLNPEDAKSLILGTIWNFSKWRGFTWLDIRLWGTIGLSKDLDASGPKGLKPKH